MTKMTPNNEIVNKFNENEEKNEEIINGLKKLIIDDNKCISYTYVSLRYGVHVKHAIQILDQFVAEQRNDGNTLSVNYLLSGNNDSDDNDNEIKMERFMIVNESDIDSAIDWYKSGYTKHIYSVGFGEDNDKIDLNFDEFDYELKDKTDLNDLQKLFYVKNPNIDFRKVNRRVAIKPIVPKIEDKSEEQTKISSNVKKESETKSKAKTNSKAKNSKKNKVSNLFSKTKTEVKVENEEKESEDPFKSDSEEDTKPKEEDVVFDRETAEEQDDEPEVVEEVKTEQKRKNGNKRQSKNKLSSSEDEEQIVSTKKRSKKYKRVRLISESDSDDNKEESALDKYVSNKKDNSKTIKKIEERKETHVDEDGYVVTKTVKREVEVNDDSQPEVIEEKTKSNEKSKQNSKKISEKKVEKKATKPSKDTKGKTQSSITSFFKPKQIST